jgi:hypothetical protein
MVYATSVMLPIYVPAISETRSSARQAKKKPRTDGSGAGREELRTGEGLKPRPARQRPPDMEGSRRAAIPSLKAAAFSSSAGFRTARAYSW